MNYQRLYDALISKAQSRAKPEGYKESHHIIPRCLGGSDNKTNLVDLTAREHFIAHHCLHKLYPEKVGLLVAVLLMSKHGKYTSREYKEARDLYSSMHPSKTPEARKKLAERMTGDGSISKTPEARNRMSKIFSGEGNPTRRLDVRKKLSEIASKKLGVLNSNFKGTIEATEIKTGKITTLCGSKELAFLGFDIGCVYKCLQGRHKTHKGYTFKRIPITIT
jgi:hypothetical protein